MTVADRWTRRDPTTGRRVRSARHGTGKRWEVRWREAGTQHRRAFSVKEDAEAWDAKLRLSPARAMVQRSVRDQYRLWISARGGLKASTLHEYARVWRSRVEPVWADRLCSSITHGEVAAWAGSIAGQSPSDARRAVVMLGGILRMGIVDGVLDADPTVGVNVRVPKGDVQPLTMDQVRTLADECAPHGLVVWTLTLTGVRFGEMAGLRGRDLDVTRCRIWVARSLTSVGGRLVESLPKSGKRRDVPCPRWLVEELAAQSRGPDEPLLATSRGKPWRESSWRRIWVPARERAGLPHTRVHDLRHTAASLAIGEGADAKVVQHMLGHASATMTMDLYSHLWDHGLDDVAARLGRLSRPDS